MSYQNENSAFLRLFVSGLTCVALLAALSGFGLWLFAAVALGGGCGKAVMGGLAMNDTTWRYRA